MSAKKKSKSQIEQKDLADDVAKILGDEFEALKTKALKIGYEYLLNDNQINDIFEWHKRQMNSFGTFKLQIDKLIKSEKKVLQKAVVNGSRLADLNSGQIKKLQKEVNKGVLQLGSAVVSTQAANINKVKIQATKIYKSNVTEALYDTISDVITKTNDYGIVTYKNGRQVKWENHMEMKVRTDIQNDIADNMVETGNNIGVVFYLATYHGDCAPDHADFQGKIYCAKNWKTICPKEYLDDVAKYINSHKIMSVEDVMGEKGNYLTKRPNCRHYFQYISIEEVLSVNNDKDLNELRNKYNLNSAGKYKPEKYEALKKQRYNERQIRKIKGQIEAKEKIISSFNGDSLPETILKENSELSVLKIRLRDAQKNQRDLLKANPGVLVRNYNREAYSRMISDFRIVKPLSLKKLKPSGIIKISEMNRSKSTSRTNIRPLSEERFNKLMIEASKKDIAYIRGTDWAEAHLDEHNAAAANIGTVLIFRKDVTISEVLEEMYHVEQNLRFLNDDKEQVLRSILNEIDAKEYLLRVAKKYKIPRQEIEETQMQLEEYRKQLEEYEKKNY